MPKSEAPMKLAQTRELFAYWNQLRRSRAMPERSEFDPAAFRGALPDTFILEIDAAGRYPVRLSGTRLNALFGRDLKGGSFLDLWRDPASRREMARLLAGVSDDALGVVAGLLASPPGVPGADCELLILPLRHYGKTHARLIGCLAPIHAPLWSGELTPELAGLVSLRILSQQDMRGPASASAPPERRRHLTVYEGGRANSAV